jgi:hypothetical protein
MKVPKYDLSGSNRSQSKVEVLNQHSQPLAHANNASAVQVSTVVSVDGVSYIVQELPKARCSHRSLSSLLTLV